MVVFLLIFQTLSNLIRVSRWKCFWYCTSRQLFKIPRSDQFRSGPQRAQAQQEGVGSFYTNVDSGKLQFITSVGLSNRGKIDDLYVSDDIGW